MADNIAGAAGRGVVLGYLNVVLPSLISAGCLGDLPALNVLEAVQVAHGMIVSEGE